VLSDRLPTPTLVAIGLAVLLVACSQSGSGRASGDGTTTPAPKPTTAATTSRQAYSVALGDALLVPVGVDDRCVSGRVVDAIGVERLNDAHVSADELPTEALFTKVDASAADRAEIEQALADAFDGCGASKNLMREAMVLEDGDVEPFLACGATNLSPLMATLLLEAWSGTGDGDVTKTSVRAGTIAAEHCPDYQVAAAAEVFAAEGVELTEEQQTCLRQQYAQHADDDEALSDADLDAIFGACI
jgi:hypothetical protein